MAQCERKKCGEYNMLRCARSAGHDGDCSFVVDHENDYPQNKKRKVGAGDTAKVGGNTPYDEGPFTVMPNVQSDRLAEDKGSERT